jgi:hypothetical protein
VERPRIDDQSVETPECSIVVALEESVGVARREAARGISRTADTFASYAKKAAKAIAR